MSCCPAHERVRERQESEFKRLTRRDTRKTQTQHKWKHGHDPHDDDAHPDSPYVYATVDPVTPSEPDTREDLNKGGPPSGVPCPTCGKDTYVVKELTPKEFIDKAGAHIAGGRPQYDKIPEDDTIVILACPSEHFTQWRTKFLPKRV